MISTLWFPVLFLVCAAVWIALIFRRLFTPHKAKGQVVVAAPQDTSVLVTPDNKDN